LAIKTHTKSVSYSRFKKELFYLKFPDYLSRLSYKEHRSAFEKKYLNDAGKLRDELESLSLTELQNRVTEELALTDWWSEGINDADYKYWLRIASWTYEESVLLAHGLEPRKINIDKIRKYSNFIEKAKSICDMEEILIRDVKHRQLHETKIPTSPLDFINWLIEKGFDVPKQFTLKLPTQYSEPIIRETKSRPSNDSLVSRPRTRLREQEQKILTCLKEQGYDPTQLPRSMPGKAGVKSSIRETLKNDNLFNSASTSFDKAWERLRNDNFIKDKEK
jgi:hypothetical protein